MGGTVSKRTSAIRHSKPFSMPVKHGFRKFVPRKLVFGCIIAAILLTGGVSYLMGHGGADARKNVCAGNANADNGPMPPLDSSKGSSAFAKPITDSLLNTDFIPVAGAGFDMRKGTAALNLQCAQGLPGAESLDIEKCLKTLEDWTKHIAGETNRYIDRYHAAPGRYFNSLPYFKVLLMMTALHEDMGIRYNPELMSGDVPYEEYKRGLVIKDSRDVFIHGLLSDRRQGTCASMPVLAVAIGEALGYPLKLVACKAHLFVRWDDGKEVFDFDVTGGGVQLKDDEFYKKWPYQLTEAELEQGFYMKSQTPFEEHCVFLINRALVLQSNGNYIEADAVLEKALSLAPNAPIRMKNPAAAELNRVARLYNAAVARERKWQEMKYDFETAMEAMNRAQLININRIPRGMEIERERRIRVMEQNARLLREGLVERYRREIMDNRSPMQ